MTGMTRGDLGCLGMTRITRDDLGRQGMAGDD